MLAELLLVLGGHPSALITPTGVATALKGYLHPGEVAALNTLATLAAHYATVRNWVDTTQASARAAVLAQNVKTSHPIVESSPGQYHAVLAGAVKDVLNSYQCLLVQTEDRVLANDDVFVQSDGLVPLSLLVATFDEWQAPMAALADLISRLEDYTAPGALMQHLATCAATGHPTLRRVFSSLLEAVWRLFLQHLVVFLLDGIAPPTSTSSAPALGLDAGADPPHRLYALDESLVPPSVRPNTRESILYVGRVAATLKREGRALPRSVTDHARQDVLAAPFDDLDSAIRRTRADVGEWLWTHILTGPQVSCAIETFANYFLTREADFALSVIREIARLREDRLVLGNPSSSSSVIRAHDLDLALLRASVGTSAEADRELETLSWSMPEGPIRPLAKPTPDDGSVKSMFTTALLGTPISLTASVSWPLDLFMTPPAVAAYSDIHAYLFALRDTHMQVLRCWSALSGAQRRRRQYTGIDEGGAGVEREQRTNLARLAWGTVRAMLFFLDQLISHFMTDIIGVQHKRLLERLSNTTQRQSGRPPSARSSSPHATYLDFLTLRQMHSRHLTFLREGLLIAERESAVLIRDILDTCKRFAGLVERWGGDVLPEMLIEEEDEAGALTAERTKAVEEIHETLHDLIADFFRMLLESQAPPAVASDVSATGSVTSIGGVTRSNMSRTLRSRAAQLAPGSRTVGEGNEIMARHVEQLLLRLDFNGVLTQWQEEKVGGAVLLPKMLDIAS